MTVAPPDDAGQAAAAAAAGQPAPGTPEADAAAQAAAAAAAAAAAQAGGGQPAAAPPTPPSVQGSFKIELTAAQRQALIEGKPLELSDEQYTAGVRSQIGALKGRATTAEHKLQEIATAQEAAERKRLVEQEQFKTLYEQEQAKTATLTASRVTDLVRAEFLLAATKLNVVDPADAFLLAKAMPTFGETIKVSDGGAVTGIAEILKTLVEAKPYLVASGQQPRVTTVGGPTNPGGGQAPVAPKDLAEAGNELERRARLLG